MCVWPKRVRPCCQLTANHICMRLMATVVCSVAQFGFLTSHVIQQRRRRRRRRFNNSSDLLALRKNLRLYKLSLHVVCCANLDAFKSYSPNATCPWRHRTKAPPWPVEMQMCAICWTWFVCVCVCCYCCCLWPNFVFDFQQFARSHTQTRTSTTLPTVGWSWLPCRSLLFTLNIRLPSFTLPTVDVNSGNVRAISSFAAHFSQLSSALKFAVCVHV